MKGKIHQNYLVYGGPLKDKVEKKNYKRYKIHLKRLRSRRIKKCRGFRRVIFKSLLVSYPTIICDEVYKSEIRRSEICQEIDFLSDKYNSLDFKGSDELYKELNHTIELFNEVRNMYQNIIVFISKLILNKNIIINLTKILYDEYKIEIFNSDNNIVNINFNRIDKNYRIEKCNIPYNKILKMNNIIYSKYRVITGRLVFNYNPID